MKALWLLIAYATCVVGFAWLALSMTPHWQQVRGATLPARGAVIALRMIGAAGIAASLAACLMADHPAMAALVWIMLLAAAAKTVAFLLTWQPRWLRPLVAWVQPSVKRDAAG
jgi:hypothetical protein